jgi:hypothetical protein
VGVCVCVLMGGCVCEWVGVCVLVGVCVGEWVGVCVGVGGCLDVCVDGVSVGWWMCMYKHI